MFYRAAELNPLNRVTVDPYPQNATIFQKNEIAQMKGKL
jgi:acyl-CoA oxidase